MSETKHTPGPWYWCDGEVKKDLPYLTSKAGKICEFGNSQTYYPQCGELPNEADRRLIAAAPEMFTALKMFLEYNDQGGPISFDTDKMWAQARAAIAKAEGGQQ